MCSEIRGRESVRRLLRQHFINLLGDALPEIESDELMVSISLPEHARQVIVIDVTSLLMRQSLSTSLLPPRKRFAKMTGEHNLHNEILNYVEKNGLGLTTQHIDSGKEFLSHIIAAFWSLNEKARCLEFI